MRARPAKKAVRVMVHPTRFAFACLQMLVGWGVFFALGVRLKRYR